MRKRNYRLALPSCDTAFCFTFFLCLPSLRFVREESGLFRVARLFGAPFFFFLGAALLSYYFFTFYCCVLLGADSLWRRAFILLSCVASFRVSFASSSLFFHVSSFQRLRNEAPLTPGPTPLPYRSAPSAIKSALRIRLFLCFSPPSPFPLLVFSLATWIGRWSTCRSSARAKVNSQIRCISLFAAAPSPSRRTVPRGHYQDSLAYSTFPRV